MGRIRRLSRLMGLVCVVTAALLAAAMAFYWAATPSRTLFSQAGLPSDPAAALGLPVRMLGFTISMIPLGALIVGLLAARRCFGAFASGRIFLSEPVSRLRTFAIAVAASALLKPLAGAALSLLLSANGGTGVRTLALNIGSDTLIALIFAGTVAVIASVMAEAVELSEENQQFI